MVLLKIPIRKNLAELKAFKTKNSNLVLEDSNLISEMSHDPEKVICNFSSHELSNDEKLLLCKGFQFLRNI